MYKIIFILCIGLICNEQVNTKPVDSPNERQVEFLNRIMPLKNKIGQVGGLDTDIDGNLIVFHRGSRKWSFDSFFNDNFNTLRYGPIKEDVLALINTDTNKEIDSWGKNKFYMPHGLTIDYDDNIWLTDVALHQVFKYDLKKSDEPLLILGTRFEKGNDEKHFCKPTSTAISQLTDDVFVADGYCNRRIVQFDKHGKFIKEFEDRDEAMIVVHSIVLLEDENLVCAASREDGRIVCFDIDSGNKRFVMKDKNMKTVYGITHDPLNQVIHAATGDNHNIEAVGITFDVSPIDFGKMLQTWSHKSEDLAGAHDIAVSPDAKRIYIGQLNGEIDQFTYERK